MTLLEFHADIEQLTFQMKRIADLLEEYIHPPGALKVATDRQSAEVTRIQPKKRWKVESEDRAWRRQSDEVAAIMPRK